MSNPTISYGYELEIADDAGLDDIPVCCDDDMTGKKTESGGIDYTCGGCGTVLEIGEGGLVSDIREKTSA
ncbi:hypothetical protein ACFWH4_01245 [Streptomyces sp. NPDC127091]|uniref:hypothetical protein n=1 Tax=Streptomyces sp. NPDC127091 TaxID=3347134 RepID=UPI0036506462